jgi:hypothetical protein
MHLRMYTDVKCVMVSHRYACNWPFHPIRMGRKLYHTKIKYDFPEPDCLTDGGADPGRPCALPFLFNGITYNECSWEQAEDDKAWCSTLVDGDGLHVSGRGKWGSCGPGCPIPDNG